jgi:hypothetical protein
MVCLAAPVREMALGFHVVKVSFPHLQGGNRISSSLLGCGREGEDEV